MVILQHGPLMNTSSSIINILNIIYNFYGICIFLHSYTSRLHFLIHKKKNSSADYKTHTEKNKIKFDDDQELSQKNFILTI